MTIHCPLNGDDDVCDQVLEITIEPGYPATFDEPGSGPLIADLDGPCRHVRDFNSGDMTDADYEYLLEHAIEESYDRAHDD